MRNEQREIGAEDGRDIERRLSSFGMAIERNLSITDRVLKQLDSDNARLSDACSTHDVRPSSSFSFRSTSCVIPEPEALADPRRKRSASASGSVKTQCVNAGRLPRRKGMSALQKFSIGTLAATVLFALLYSVADSRLTFAQVVASVQKATSYSYDFRMNMRNDVDGLTPQLTGKWHWQAPDSFRSEDFRVQLDGKPDPNRKEISIFFRSKKGIELDTGDKTYIEILPFSGPMSPLMMLQNLSDSEVSASKKLGSRVITGIQCTGFEVAIEKVDPDTGEDSKLEVWIDNRTRLPQQVSISMFNSFPSVDLIMENFKWNELLDQELFSVVPPTGYAPRKPAASQQRTHDQVVQGIVDAFRLYAEYSGGQYPQVKMIYGDVMLDSLYKFAGISLEQYLAAIGKDNKLIEKDKERWNKYSRITESTRNWAEINGIMRHDASASYNGLTVGPTDKDMVLFKWRRDDGMDQVIYGDLHVDVQSP